MRVRPCAWGAADFERFSLLFLVLSFRLVRLHGGCIAGFELWFSTIYFQIFRTLIAGSDEGACCFLGASRARIAATSRSSCGLGGEWVPGALSTRVII